MMKRTYYAALSVALCLMLVGVSPAQDVGTPASGQKYKLTVVEGASTSKRAKKGRVSSQSVVKITDQNNIPVPAIAVTFTIPQFVGGAAFANGALTSVVATNAAGIATSGSFSLAAGSSFSMSVAASVPGAALTATVPVSASAAAAGAAGAGGAGASGGLSTGAIAGIAAGVVAAVAVGLAVGLTRGGNGAPPAGAGPVAAATSISLGSATVHP